MTHFGSCRITCFLPAMQSSCRCEESTKSEQQARQLTELLWEDPILSQSRKIPEEEWHGRMASIAVHGAIRA